MLELEDALWKHLEIENHVPVIFVQCPVRVMQELRVMHHIPLKSIKMNIQKNFKSLPAGSAMIETDCLSMVETKRSGRFFVQLNSLNKSTILGFVAYILCRKIRSL